MLPPTFELWFSFRTLMVAVAAAVMLNRWYRKSRAAMSPEEAKQEERQDNYDMQNW